MPCEYRAFHSTRVCTDTAKCCASAGHRLARACAQRAELAPGAGVAWLSAPSPPAFFAPSGTACCGCGCPCCCCCCCGCCSVAPGCGCACCG
eukprot:1871062-Rhodomonas_salina.2